MKVSLSHAKNPDIHGGYWQPPIDPARVQWVEVDTFVAASKACREFIARNGLGAGNWVGGEIWKDGKQVAHVSFNGRVWEGNRKNWNSNTKEIV